MSLLQRKSCILQWCSSSKEAEDNYFYLIRNGIEDYCEKNGINVIRAYKSDSDYTAALKEADGIICIGKFSDKEIQTLKDINNIIVFLDMPVSDIEITSIALDFEQAVTDGVDYLYSLGHKTAAFLGGTEYLSDGSVFNDRRQAAFEKACSEREIDFKCYIPQEEFTVKAGYDTMLKIIEEENLPTAVFAANDSIAIGAMKALYENGFEIPGDISVIGFNNTEMSAYTHPSLTTLNAPVYEMGAYGVDIVKIMINSKNRKLPYPMRIYLPCRLIKRDSCGEPGETRTLL
ncbi:MAG: substrate-binding domain-containing protein [Clostridiales bacterium]|nr:substrate-binding domain-containing protein [Clostridiales bacterium]